MFIKSKIRGEVQEVDETTWRKMQQIGIAKNFVKVKDEIGLLEKSKSTSPEIIKFIASQKETYVDLLAQVRSLIDSEPQQALILAKRCQAINDTKAIRNIITKLTK